jgi:hypothetical protein
VSLLSIFDGPAHNPVCVQRVSSTVALQSLSLLNSDFVRARARAFAKRVLAVSSPSPDKRKKAEVKGEAAPLIPAFNERAGERGSRLLVATTGRKQNDPSLPNPLPPAREEREKTSTAALQFAFELAYDRPPTAAELSAAKNFLHEQETAYAGKSDATEQIWTDLCQMLLASNAFLYVD